MSTPDEPAAQTPAADLPVRQAHFGLVSFMNSVGILSLSNVSNIARGIITAKILAITLGPSMTGVLAQILNFSSFLFQIVPLGLTTGVAKLVAESSTQRTRVGVVIGTSTAISVASALACVLLLTPFSGEISRILTGSPAYGLPVILILLSLPLFNVAGVLSYILQGLADIRRLTAANVATAAGSLVVLVPAVLAFGLLGATAAVAIGSVLQAVFFTIAVWQAHRSRGWSLSAIRWSGSTAKSLLEYGGVLLASGIGAWGSVLVVRTLGIHSLGEFQNGIYQVVNAVSTQYMAVFIGWMSAYVFPRLVADGDRSRLQTLLNSGLRANLLIMGTGLALTVALREVVVRLLYSPAFLPAAPILPIQVLGDYARVIGWSFGISLFAMGRTRAYLLAMLTQDLLWIAISSVTLHPFGTPAIALGYSLSSMAWPVLMYPMVRRWFGVRIDAEGALLCAVGLVAIVVAIVVPTIVGILCAAAIPAVIYAMRRRRVAQPSPQT